jgi:hypothetical protein
LLTTVEVGETARTDPATSVLGSAASVTVAPCPTAIDEASASAKPATTCRDAKLSIVMNDDEEPDEPEEPDEELPDDPDPAPVPVEPVADPPDEVEPELPPETVPPTTPLRAVTVPLIGAVRVVSATAFWSAVTVSWSWRT